MALEFKSVNSPLERGGVGICGGRGVLMKRVKHTPPLSKGESHDSVAILYNLFIKRNNNTSTLPKYGIDLDGAVKKRNYFVGDIQANAIAHKFVNIGGTVKRAENFFYFIGGKGKAKVGNGDGNGPVIGI